MGKEKYRYEHRGEEEIPANASQPLKIKRGRMPEL